MYKELLEEILNRINKIKNVDDQYRIAILSRMDTEEKAQKMLKWMKENPQVTISEVTKKAVEIKQSTK